MCDENLVQRLIQVFNLQAEVEEFVKRRVRELVSHKNEFSFSGGNRTRTCTISEPHIPHVIDYYKTVRWGRLEHFCLGKSGLTPEGELFIIVELYSPGSPEWPTKARGYWFIAPTGSGESEK